MEGLGGAVFLAAATALAFGGSGLFGGALLAVGEAVEGFSWFGLLAVGEAVEVFSWSGLLAVVVYGFGLSGCFLLKSILLADDGETAFEIVRGAAILFSPCVGEAVCFCSILVSSSVTGLLSALCEVPSLSLGLGLAGLSLESSE